MRLPRAVLLLALLLPVGCRPAAEPVCTLRGETMGTTYMVKLRQPPRELEQVRLQREIDATLARVNRLMSTYDPNSELSRLNRYEGDKPFPISPETARVLGEALRIGRLSGGAYDVTVGPLVNLWSFGPEARGRQTPSPEDIAAARTRIGLEYVSLKAGPAVQKRRPGLQIDLSSIAKGFGADQVAELLERQGVRHYLIEIGGEVRARGRNTEGRAWQIGIEAPLSDQLAVERIVGLDNVSLATSGDYRNFFEAGGRRYSHILDPRTGQPIVHALASVSVLAPSCATADAWATALLVLGPEEGFLLAAREKLPVLMIVRAGDRFIERMTPGFAQALGDGAAWASPPVNE